MKYNDRGTVSPFTVLGIYLRAAFKYPFLAVTSIVGIVGVQAANVIAPLYLRQVFNILAGNAPSPEVVQALLSLVLIIGGWWFFRLIVERMEHLVGLRLILHAMRDLSLFAFDRLIDHSHDFFISNFTGSLTHNVNKFAKSFQVFYDVVVLTFFPTALFAAGAVVVLYTRSPLLGILLGISTVLFFLFQIWVSNLRQPLRRLYAEADSKATATLADAIGNQPTIATFAAGDIERRRYRESHQELHEKGLRSWQADVWIWTAVGFFMILIEVAMLYSAVLLWQKGYLTIGDFVLIQSYLLVLFERITAIQNNLKKIFTAFADASEMVAVLHMPHEVRDIPNAETLTVMQGGVMFDDVSFYFHRTNPILENFNIKIDAGERVALVGPSGAGKSTITKLLLRLYDTAAGTITIDGQDIARVTQNSLRSAIAFVPQEPNLFHRTLMENIRYGKPSATDEEVVEAAEKAHCNEFIKDLPHGYETYVGERGVKLSGGERQRVAIARAILKNAPILILDEATSSLDSESESFIQDALSTLMKGKTVVVIAHRLSTVMQMDRIIVLQNGSIVAEGTHDELLSENGLYERLWSIQAGGFISN